MPRLSIFKPEKGADYKFFDRNIREMFTVGGTDIHFHKCIAGFFINVHGPMASLDNETR